MGKFPLVLSLYHLATPKWANKNPRRDLNRNLASNLKFKGKIKLKKKFLKLSLHLLLPYVWHFFFFFFFVSLFSLSLWFNVLGELVRLSVYVQPTWNWVQGLPDILLHFFFLFQIFFWGCYTAICYTRSLGQCWGLSNERLLLRSVWSWTVNLKVSVKSPNSMWQKERLLGTWKCKVHSCPGLTCLKLSPRVSAGSFNIWVVMEVFSQLFVWWGRWRRRVYWQLPPPQKKRKKTKREA